MIILHVKQVLGPTLVLGSSWILGSACSGKSPMQSVVATIVQLKMHGVIPEELAQVRIA